MTIESSDAIGEETTRSALAISVERRTLVMLGLGCSACRSCWSSTSCRPGCVPPGCRSK